MKTHSRKWKAWARRMAQFCQRERYWLDDVCLWAHENYCCPYYAVRENGGWRIVCRAVSEGHWTHIAKHPSLMHWWLDGMDAEIRAHMEARGLPVSEMTRQAL